MYILLFILSFSLMSTIALGIYYEIRPLKSQNQPPHWLKNSVGLNLMVFMVAELALLFLGMQEVMASGTTEVMTSSPEISVGKGLALIGIGLPTAFATIGAGIAVGPVGASSLAVVSEKPEMFGRSLIYLGLAEGIAIYGLVVTILLLGKI